MIKHTLMFDIVSPEILHTYIHTSFICLRRSDLRQHKADVDLRLIKIYKINMKNL